MAEWTPKLVRDEWDARAARKYGTELRAEALGLMADVMFGSPPRFDIVEWARTVAYKPGTTVDVFHDVTNMAYVLSVNMLVPDVGGASNTVIVSRRHNPPAHMIESLPPAEAEKQATNIVRRLIIDLEHHEIDEWLTVGGKRVREPTHG